MHIEMDECRWNLNSQADVQDRKYYADTGYSH